MRRDLGFGLHPGLASAGWLVWTTQTSCLDHVSVGFPLGRAVRRLLQAGWGGDTPLLLDWRLDFVLQPGGQVLQVGGCVGASSVWPGAAALAACSFVHCARELDLPELQLVFMSLTEAEVAAQQAVQGMLERRLAAATSAGGPADRSAKWSEGRCHLGGGGSELCWRKG